MDKKAVFAMPFSKVYPRLITKAEKKGRSREEVDSVTCWLTGYTPEELEHFLHEAVTYGVFLRTRLSATRTAA